LNDLDSSSVERDSLDSQLTAAKAAHGDGLLSRHSRLWSLLGYGLRNLHVAEPTHPKPHDRQWEALAAGSYAAYFEKLYDDPISRAHLDQGVAELSAAARSAGVPVVSVVFPVFVDLANYRLARVHERIAEVFRRQGLRLYDLLAVYETLFRQGGSVFVLNALHPNPLGHRVAALFMLQRLAQDGYLPSLTRSLSQQNEFAELDEWLGRALQLSNHKPNN
jgi:hypothetical protein